MHLPKPTPWIRPLLGAAALGAVALAAALAASTPAAACLNLCDADERWDLEFVSVEALDGDTGVVAPEWSVEATISGGGWVRFADGTEVWLR